MAYVYPILLALGILAGLLWLLLVDPDSKAAGHGLDLQSLALARLDAGLAALAGGLIGARAAYVLSHWSYFASDPQEAFIFRSGGLSWVGGTLGALAAMVAFAVVTRRSVWRLADAMAFPAALLAAASWLGCLFDSCAYGRPAPTGALTPLASDYFGIRLSRWPVQLLGTLASFALALSILALMPRGLRPGMLACLTLAAMGIIGLALSFARGDAVPLLGGIRLDALGSASILALAAGGLAQRWLSRSA